MSIDPKEQFGYDKLTAEELREAWRTRRVDPGDGSVDARRREFIRLTELRAALFRTLAAPASVKKWGGDRK